MNKIPWFFLILLIAVLVFISVKSIEGLDMSNNYVRGRDISYNIYNYSKETNNQIYVDEMFTPANIALVTIGVVLFIIMIFLIIKLNT